MVLLFLTRRLQDTLNLPRAQAARADVNALRTSVNHCFHATDVRSPAPVPALMGEGNAVAESTLLSADFTFFCHRSHLLLTFLCKISKTYSTIGLERMQVPSNGVFNVD